MKVIDLLNKIANGEEVPKEIVFEDKKYKYNTGIDYEDEDGNYLLSSEPVCIMFLNTEVEILEEEKKIPEKLIPTSLKGIDNLDEKIEIAHIDTVSVIDKVNEIIDYLKSKGE